MLVEHQIAIIYCGTKGLLQKVPVKSILNFQDDFLHFLDVYHQDILDNLRKGILSDELTATLEKVAKEVAVKYEK
jgi:F-type H+-transporting ATPase subunit alpha